MTKNQKINLENFKKILLEELELVLLEEQGAESDFPLDDDRVSSIKKIISDYLNHESWMKTSKFINNVLPAPGTPVNIKQKVLEKLIKMKKELELTKFARSLEDGNPLTDTVPTRLKNFVKQMKTTKSMDFPQKIEMLLSHDGFSMHFNGREEYFLKKALTFHHTPPKDTITL